MCFLPVSKGIDMNKSFHIPKGRMVVHEILELSLIPNLSDLIIQRFWENVNTFMIFLKHFILINIHE